VIYVTVLRGETPLDAQPILASSDPELVRAVIRVLRRYLEPIDRGKTPAIGETDHAGERDKTAEDSPEPDAA